jgi:hypothetical protein
MVTPVTAKMIHSTVNTCNRIVLRDGCPLHMVKLVGAVWNYHENVKNTIINVEDGTGFVQVIVWHKGNECKAALALIQECKLLYIIYNQSVMLYLAYTRNVFCCDSQMAAHVSHHLL